MTGYVVTRWYRAPEVILNWMHYTQTGEELPACALLHGGLWQLLRGEAPSWVGGWAGGGGRPDGSGAHDPSAVPTPVCVSASPVCVCPPPQPTEP